MDLATALAIKKWEESGSTEGQELVVSDLLNMSSGAYSKSSNHGSYSLASVLTTLADLDVAWNHPKLPPIRRDELAWLCYAEAMGYIKQTYEKKLKLKSTDPTHPSHEDFLHLLYLFADEEWFFYKDYPLIKSTPERQLYSETMRTPLSDAICQKVQERLGNESVIVDPKAARLKLEKIEAIWGEWWWAAISRITYGWEV